MTHRVVYDTNVIVSAALYETSLPASLVALAIEGHVRLFLSPAILDEYTEVLNRPKFQFDPNAVERLLRDLTRAATMVTPTMRVTDALDEPDNRFLECAQEARADYLVTGNRRHFPFRTFQNTSIVSPAEFAQIVVT